MGSHLSCFTATRGELGSVADLASKLVGPGSALIHKLMVQSRSSYQAWTFCLIQLHAPGGRPTDRPGPARMQYHCRGNGRWIVLTDLLTTALDGHGLGWSEDVGVLGGRDRLDGRGRP